MERPTSSSIRRLIDLRVYVERELAAGPWDEWDQKVLVAWREEVEATLSLALRHWHFV